MIVVVPLMNYGRSRLSSVLQTHLAVGVIFCTCARELIGFRLECVDTSLSVVIV